MTGYQVRSMDGDGRIIDELCTADEARARRAVEELRWEPDVESVWIEEV